MDNMRRLRIVIYWILKINFIKTLYYSIKFKGKVIVGKAKIKISGNSRIIFEDNNSILYIGINYSYPISCTLDMYDGTLFVSGKVFINRAVKIRIFNNSTLRIGNNSYINEGAKIYCREGIEIGAECAIAFDTLIMDNDSHQIIVDGRQINQDKPIFIGNKVWVGGKSVILKGSKIENNVVVGAQSLVNGSLLSNYIYGGIPAKRICCFQYWSV